MKNISASVYKMISIIVPKGYEREDFKQELAMYYWENSEKLDVSKVKTYYSLKNKLVDLVRHYGCQKYIFPVVENIDLFMDQYVDCELLKRAEKLLECEMSDNTRKVLELACKNYTQRDISEETGMHESGVFYIVKKILIPLAVTL